MYDPNPVIHVQSEAAVTTGLEAILSRLDQSLPTDGVIAIEVYPCVTLEPIRRLAEGLSDRVYRAEDAFLPPDRILSMLQRDITDDRILGRRTLYHFDHLLDEEARRELASTLAEGDGRRIVWGTGASLVTDYDVLIYADITRWETQLRYRTDRYANWMTENHDEDPSRKIKQAYFVEWVMADRLKQDLGFDYPWYLDMNDDEAPKLVPGEALREAYRQISRRPFRLRPFFDPGVWGGHWMQETFGVDPEKQNLAWSFDGVPEENSLLLEFGGTVIEIPATNLVLAEPRALLGERVYGRFGADFPIRFDLLDTVGGQNLSLQVHPVTDYIQDTFGMPYTQDESYYILHAEPETYVYAGLKRAIDREQMAEDLYAAERGEISFDADRYVNRVPVATHDHISYPGGTVHCSGRDMVVLEISSTPNRFTFKLWDWDRVDLDGLPRPINLGHGLKNIQFNRDTDYVYRELYNQIEVLETTDDYRIERTGLHPLEYIETRRYWFSDRVTHPDLGSVRMLNLVEGDAAIIESPDGAFEPFEVHYAETFIVPASVETFTIRPLSADGTRPETPLATIEATVR